MSALFAVIRRLNRDCDKSDLTNQLNKLTEIDLFNIIEEKDDNFMIIHGKFECLAPNSVSSLLAPFSMPRFVNVAKNSLKIVDISIKNLNSESCIKKLSKRLRACSVRITNVDLQSKVLTFEYSMNSCSVYQIQSVLKSMGYQSQILKSQIKDGLVKSYITELILRKIQCRSCVTKISHSIIELPIFSALIDQKNKKVTIWHEKSLSSLEILNFLYESGFPAVIVAQPEIDYFVSIMSHNEDFNDKFRELQNRHQIEFSMDDFSQFYLPSENVEDFEHDLTNIISNKYDAEVYYEMSRFAPRGQIPLKMLARLKFLADSEDLYSTLERFLREKTGIFNVSYNNKENHVVCDFMTGFLKEDEILDDSFRENYSIIRSSVMKIVGMKCQSCSNTIETAIKSLRGISSIEIELNEGQARIDFFPLLIPLEEIVGAITSKGFKVEEGLEINRKTDTEPQNGAHVVPNKGELKKARMRVTGMTCASCVAGIERILTRSGVVSVSVSLLAGHVEVVFDPEVISSQDCSSRIEAIGFGSEVTWESMNDDSAEIHLNIRSMFCSACPGKIKKHVEGFDGVISVSVTLSKRGRGVVKYAKSVISGRKIIAIINDLGFDASLVVQESGDYTHVGEIKKWKTSFLFSLICGIPVMIVMIVFSHIKRDGDACKFDHLLITYGLSLENLLLFLLATPVQFFAGKEFYLRAYKYLKVGLANMDLLIVMTTTFAYLYSICVIVAAGVLKKCSSPKTFFETTPMLMVFISLGRWIENIAKAKSSSAIHNLVSIKPVNALLVNLDEKGMVISSENVPADLVEKDEVVKILPGSRIPVDGIVISGSSSCDESLLTGESVSVGKNVGDGVICGSFNLSGTLLVKASNVGSGTTLAQILDLVRKAQTSKPKIQRISDKIAGIFVNLVLSLSLVTFIAWVIVGYVKKTATELTYSLAFQFSMSTMAIACPCALGLATPTAVMVGTGVGAVRGILIKGGLALESLWKVNTIVFDKTGTITEGISSVDEIMMIENINRDDLLSIIYEAESNSEHPFADTIVKYIKQQSGFSSNFIIHDFISVPGHGIHSRGHFDGNNNENLVAIGNRNLMNKYGIPLSLKVTETLISLEDKGYTPVICAIDSSVVCVIVIKDKIKPNARLVVYELKRMGYEIFLLTGDNKRTASVIAKKVGIDNVFAEVLPSHKLEKIEELQSRGKLVAMVGDGVNDSPALAKADAGIAVGSGAQIAVNTADVVLMKNDLVDVIRSLDLSRAIVRRIRFNFVAASIYNLLAIPFAAGVLYTVGFVIVPWMASAAMVVSSLTVVILSLFLKRHKSVTVNSLETENYRKYCHAFERESSKYKKDTRRRSVCSLPVSFID